MSNGAGIGTFQSYYEITLPPEYAPSTVSWMPKLQASFMFGMGPIVGKLYDIFCPRHILIGSFLHVFGSDDGLAGHKILPASPLSWHLQRHRRRCHLPACDGVYPRLVQPTARRRVRDVSTGSSIGGVVFPIMVNRLTKSVWYAWTMLIGTFVILGLLGVANLTVRTRGTRTGRTMSRESLVRPFGEAVNAGMSAAMAQYFVAILNAGRLLGRLSAGVCSDRVGAYNTLVCVVFLAGVLVMGLWIPAAGNAAIIVFAVVFGFTTGTYVSLAPVLMVAISPLEEIGYRTGLLFLFASVGGLTTSPSGGAILQRDGGSYTGMKVSSGGCCWLARALWWRPGWCRRVGC
ncbi:hypothetical protein ALT_1064 [Aspergillus lentulus]|uniref:Major facilitator superfamily (MFS) profile domain-containing protein n=1 Tax=Aspergillus lentulus TaxID=293939 RepID=A0AAN4PCF0_ASPLE|nr:hypothetical protein ALT_1064 [Aspergillus lentulus]